jgi:Protein of unknown function, DUF481
VAKRERQFEWVLCGALCMLLPARARGATGGEVNVARGMAEEEAGLKGQFNVDVGVTTGNTDLVQLKAGLVLAYEAPPHSMLLSLHGGYAEHDRTALAEQLGLHAHYRHRVLEHLALEGYVNSSHDKFAGLDVQFAAGPNVVFLFAVDTLRVDVGLGYMLQYEDYGEITGDLAGQHDTAHRAQLYVFITYDLAENLEFIEHAFYMPRLDAPGPSDYMIISASSLSIKLNPVLSYQNSFNLSFDKPPPANTKTLNTELMAGLALKF